MVLTLVLCCHQLVFPIDLVQRDIFHLHTKLIILEFGYTPDDLRTIFKWEPRGPSGMKNATNRAITTKNEPNTNGGPGRDCN